MLAISILEAFFPLFIVVPLFALCRRSAAVEPIEGIVQITSREVEPRRNWIHVGLILISLLFFADNVLLLRRAESGIVSHWIYLEAGAVAYALAATLCAVRDRYRGRALLWLLVVSFAVEAARWALTLSLQLRGRVFLPTIILPAVRLVLYIGTLVAVSSPTVRYTSHVQPTESSNLISATGAEQTYGSAGMGASTSRQGREDVEGYVVPDSSPKAMQSLDVCDPAPQGCAPSLDHRHPTMLRKTNMRPRSRSPSSSSPSPPMLPADLPSVIPFAQREKRRSFNVNRSKQPPSAIRTGSGSSEGKGKERERERDRDRDRERGQEAISLTQYQASASSQGHGGSGSDSSDATEVERETNRLLDGLRAQTEDPRRRKATAPPPVPSSPGPLRHQPYHVRRPPQLAHPLPAKKTLLPIRLPTPMGDVQITRRRGEDFLIVSAITGAVVKLGPGLHEWAVAGEMSVLVVMSIVYVSFRTVKRPPKPIAVRPPRQSFSQAVTPSPEGRIPDEPGSRGRVWGTDDKDYRECPDDGAITALLLGPLLAASLLVSTIERKLSGAPPLPDDWMIEQPLFVRSTPIYDPSNPSSREPGGDALSALAFSRRNLVQLTTLLSFVLLVQVMWSRRAELRFLRRLEQDSTTWIPRREWRRSLTVVGFALVVTSGCVIVQSATKAIGGAIWSDLSFSDVVIASLFYQFSLYVCVRLARRGFTLGELGIVCHAATTLFMETVNVTRNKIQVLQTPYIKTYRLPTPLLAFQLALIPGSLLAGFLLSPLLVLARNIAQKPVHRLRYPAEREIHRRALAAGFYVGAAIVCVGIVGTWVQWCIQWRNPWMWVVRWLLLGTRPWTRPVLIAYWGLLAVISVAAWTRQLARARRQRPRTQVQVKTPTGQNISAVATQVMDAADQRLPTLSVNARRKFFHALAVIMFVPGIAIDPAFTHLSFSLAFALFTFAEYVRYFALWPFGANVHLFLNEFLDHKDSGTAILSHFYLLTGCAGPLWLESSSQIMSYFGVLSLGVGDALASIVGRRMGHVRWSNANGKTLEGSLAFAATVLLSSFGLWAAGLVADYDPYAYTIMVVLTSVLEALSAQNDNLILPLYGWCVGTLLGV